MRDPKVQTCTKPGFGVDVATDPRFGVLFFLFLFFWLIGPFGDCDGVQAAMRRRNGATIITPLRFLCEPDLGVFLLLFGVILREGVEAVVAAEVAPGADSCFLTALALPPLLFSLKLDLRPI